MLRYCVSLKKYGIHKKKLVVKIWSGELFKVLHEIVGDLLFMELTTVNYSVMLFFLSFPVDFYSSNWFLDKIRFIGSWNTWFLHFILLWRWRPTHDFGCNPNPNPNFPKNFLSKFSSNYLGNFTWNPSKWVFLVSQRPDEATTSGTWAFPLGLKTVRGVWNC